MDVSKFGVHTFVATNCVVSASEIRMGFVNDNICVVMFYRLC
jgi:hypothetical protein